MSGRDLQYWQYFDIVWKWEREREKRNWSRFHLVEHFEESSPSATMNLVWQVRTSVGWFSNAYLLLSLVLTMRTG